VKEARSITVSFLSRLKITKPEPVEISPMERLEAAVDELNAAMENLRLNPTLVQVRPFVTSYDPRTRRRGAVVLGYWNGAAREFNITYESAHRS
jgi:hypothetical protein